MSLSSASTHLTAKHGPNFMKFGTHMNTGADFVIVKNETDRPNSATYRDKKNAGAVCSMFFTPQYMTGNTLMNKSLLWVIS